LKTIESNLNKEEWFVDFKKTMKEHYMDAIAGKKEFGFNITENKQIFYGEFAVAHRTYIENNIFEFLKKVFPEYNNLISYDEAVLWKGYAEDITVGNYTFKDTRDVTYEEYCKQLYVVGRFDDRWMKKEINYVNN